MHLLLPPSERKSGGGSGTWNPGVGRFPLREGRLTVTDAHHRDPGHAAHAPTGGVVPAWQRYAGVVWQHLDPGTLSDAALRRAAESVVVVSALGGLFAWEDPVPSYKLKMNARLEGVGRLSTFWAPQLSPLLAGDVIDLTALEQHAAIPRPAEAMRWWRVELVGPDGRRSGHHGKAAKGRLARSLLETDDPFALLEEYSDPDGWLVRIIR